MAILLFRLNDVPSDEAHEVRELLDAAGISFYETSAGNWGISVAAIWLAEEEDFARARLLLNDYQQQRAFVQRQRYLETQQAGFWQHNLRKPLQFFCYCAALLLVAYASVKWVIELGF
jgi:hypothetical protein